MALFLNQKARAGAMAAKAEVNNKPEHLTPQATPEKSVHTQESLNPTPERISRSPSFRHSHQRMSRRSKTPSINSLHCDNECIGDEAEFDINDTVIINCGGVRHEVLHKTFQRHPETRLTKIIEMKRYYREKAKEFYFDRDPYVFSAILNYYRYGELHLPSDICNVVVAKELRYWGIQEDNMEACCWLEYNAAWDQMHTLSQFEEKQTINYTIPTSEKANCFQRNRPKIWLMLEDPYSSKYAQVLAWVSLAFVVVSIFSFCAETHPYFTSEFTQEEYHEYHGISITGVFRSLNIIPGKTPQSGNAMNNDPDRAMNSSSPEVTTSAIRAARDLPRDDSFYRDDPRSNFLWHEGRSQGQANNRHNLEGQAQSSAIRATDVDEARDLMEAAAQELLATKRGHPISFIHSAGSRDDEKDRSSSGEVNTRATNANKINEEESAKRVKRDDPVTLEGNDDMMVTTAEPESSTMSTSHKRKMSRLTKPHPVLFFIDIVCYCFFTVEIGIRFLFCDNRINFFKDMFNVVDLVAILPFYVEIIVNSMYQEEQYKKSIVDVLLFTRILRIFRIFRLIRRHRGLQILVYTIRASMKEILLLLLFVIIGTILFSSLVYYAEESSDKPFTSIPHSFWWAVITMTTVGYGDMVPTTPWGFVIGACCSVSGVLLIAFTVPVIVNNFLLIYRYVQFQRERLDPADVAFRQKWEAKLSGATSEGSLRKATIHVHVEADANNEGNAINAV